MSEGVRNGPARRAWGVARRLAPGVGLAVVVAATAKALEAGLGWPAMLLALGLGMLAVRASAEGAPTRPGVEFAAKKILRFGVALLGARITLEEIAGLGATPILTTLAAVGGTILAGGWLAARLGFARSFGTLTAGATAICGASAALALSSVLPKHANHERDTIFAVIGVTTLSTVAMVLYPGLTALLGFDDTTAGLLLGGTIHDVAQVVGAGYAVSGEAGDVATVAKLLRVALLVPCVLAVAWVYRAELKAEGGKAQLPIPGFLFGFVALVALNSAGLLPEPLRLVLVEVSGWCLVTAVAALGMKTSVGALRQVGGRAVALLVAETLLILAIVLALLLALA
jgi:uncharacterized integral membrane protein (TIGR00698 family)